MKFISEFEILDKYKIQEATLSRLQDLGLLPESQSKRGRLVYPFSKSLDLTFRTAKAYYYEVSDKSMRLVPCFRAFLALAISEGATAAWSMMQRRGFFDRYGKKDLVDRWQRFKTALPRELRDFVIGKTDDVTPEVESLLSVLGITEVFYGPEKLKMPEIYDQVMVQQDVDALLLAGAKPDFIVDMISRIHHIDLGTEIIRDYKLYYFDTDMLTAEDFSHHLKKFPGTSEYRKLLSLALTERGLIDFITAAGYPVRISIEEALSTVVTPLYKQIKSKACGPLTEKSRNDATKNVVHIVEALEKYTNEDDELSEDAGDMLRLRHDAAVNANQLTVVDIPEEDFDVAANSYGRDDSGEEGAGGSA